MHETTAIDPRKVHLSKGFTLEARNRSLISSLSLLIGFFSTVIFMVILFSVDYTADTNIAILLFWGYFTSLSSILVYPYYGVSQLILNLSSEDKDLASLSFEMIQENPELYLHPALRYMNSRKSLELIKSQDRIDIETIIEVLDLRDRIDWKFIGKRFFIFYLIVSPIVLFFFAGSF